MLLVDLIFPEDNFEVPLKCVLHTKFHSARSRYVARRLFRHICHLYVFLSFIRFYGSFVINFTGNFVTFRSIL